MNLLPCPNPECGDCGPMLIGDQLNNNPTEWFVRCMSCNVTGPFSGSPEQAERLWSLLPREEPWILVTDALPDTDDWCEVYEADGALTLAKWDPKDELWDWIRGGQLKPTHWRKWRPRRP